MESVTQHWSWRRRVSIVMKNAVILNLRQHMDIITITTIKGTYKDSHIHKGVLGLTDKRDIAEIKKHRLGRCFFGRGSRI